MASFHANIRGQRLRKGENKNYRSVPFQPTRNIKFQKKTNKI